MASIRELGPGLMIGAATLLLLAAPAAADDGPTETPAPVPHLSSPDNLPPGAVAEPPPTNTGRMGYLRELWHAVQTQEISGGNALLLLTQMPMDAPTPAAPAEPPPPLPTPPPEAPLDPAP